jgi:hypothetical protein
MPLNSEIASSLTYLRKKYRVSERDLVALAKKLQIEPENEETWEEITRNYLKQRRIRQLSRATR